MYLDIENVGKEFRSTSAERVRALDGVSLAVEQGEILTLLGPSGCGKTTLLRSIAGLERPDRGVIALDGRTMFDAARRVVVPPHDRDMAMIFQSYALWPHMTVYQNIAFPLRRGKHRMNRAQAAERVESVLELVRLRRHASRHVYELSGGQQQRVALARALALQPKLLLLDEPLSNLDQQLKVQTRRDMHSLLKRLDITAVHVTHDQGEALALSDRIAVVDQGHILQVDTPGNIYRHPADVTVARFLGHGNFLEGIVSIREGVTEVKLASGERIAIDPSRVRPGLADGSECVVLIPAAAIAVGTGKPTEAGLSATITRLEFMGDTINLECETDAGQLLRARVNVGGPPLAVGARLALQIDPATCAAMPKPEAESS